MTGLVRLHSATLENFLSFEGTHSYLLADQGLVFVGGQNKDDPSASSNGSGKSAAFLDGPTWALFGKMPRDCDADQVVNDRVGKGACVTVRLEVPNAGAITVQRFRKLKGRNGVRLWIGAHIADSEDAKREDLKPLEATALDATKTTELIEGLLGLDLEVWLAAVYRAQTAEARFAALRDSDQKALLTSVFQLGVIDAWLDHAKAAAAIASSELATRRAQIEALTSELGRINLPLLEEQAHQQAASREAQLDRLRTEVTRLRSEWARERGRLTRLEQLQLELGQLRARPPAPPADLEPEPLEPLLPAAPIPPKPSQPVRAQGPLVVESPPPAPEARPVLDVTAIRQRGAELNAEASTLRERMRGLAARAQEQRQKSLTLRQKRSGYCTECGAALTPEHADQEAERLIGFAMGYERDAEALSTEARRVHDEAVRIDGVVESLESDHRQAVAAIQARNDAQQAEWQREIRQLRVAAQEETERQRAVQDAHYQALLTDWQAATTQVRLQWEEERRGAYATWRIALAQVSTRNAAKILAARSGYDTQLAGLEMGIRELNGVRGEVARLEQQGKAVRVELEAAERAPNHSQTQLESARAKQLEITQLLEEHQLAKRQLEARAKLLDFWVTGFGNRGLKAFVLDEKIQELTARANRWLTKLSGGASWIRFETQTATKAGTLNDAFSVRVFRSEAGRVVERPYGALSGGQQARVALAIDWAIADAVASRAEHRFDILCLDEAFRHLDKAGRDLVLDALGELRRDRGSVFVADHDSVFQSAFERSITIVREHGQSRFT